MSKLQSLNSFLTNSYCIYLRIISFFVSRKYFLPLFLLFQFIGLKILTFFPEFIEKYYTNGLYIYISHFSRTIFGRIPFSFGDIIYTLVIVWIIIWFYKHRKENWKRKLLAVVNFMSIFYFLFNLLWALNYYRVPLYQKLNIKTDYTDEQLVSFTKKLIIKTNEVHFQITKDTAKKVVSPFTPDGTFKTALNGYENLASKYPYFKYEIPSQKKSLISYFLSYMGFGGYLNPFTNEAQVNSEIPMYAFPATLCHEMAHQIGFGSESECNFIGFMTATHNDNLHFKYAGYTFALRYCLNNIGFKNEKLYNDLKKTVNPGIFENYKESEAFHKAHETFINTIFEAFYDNFLKLNQQKDGLQSYSKFVDLMVNYYDKKEL